MGSEIEIFVKNYRFFKLTQDISEYGYRDIHNPYFVTLLLCTIYDIDLSMIYSHI